eukprot:9453405-Pyramimonas_sp.AAC.1
MLRPSNCGEQTYATKTGSARVEDTVELTVKTLLSHHVTRGDFNSSADALRTPLLSRVEP